MYRRAGLLNDNSKSNVIDLRLVNINYVFGKTCEYHKHINIITIVEGNPGQGDRRERSGGDPERCAHVGRRGTLRRAGRLRGQGRRARSHQERRQGSPMESKPRTPTQEI